MTAKRVLVSFGQSWEISQTMAGYQAENRARQLVVSAGSFDDLTDAIDDIEFTHQEKSNA